MRFLFFVLLLFNIQLCSFAYFNSDEELLFKDLYNKLEEKDFFFVKKSINTIREKIKEPFQIHFLELVKKKEGQRHIACIIKKKISSVEYQDKSLQNKSLEYYDYYSQYTDLYLVYFDMDWIHEIRISNSRWERIENISHFEIDNYLNLDNYYTQIQVRVYSVPFYNFHNKGELLPKHQEDLFLFLIEPGKKLALKLLFSEPIYLFSFNSGNKTEEIIEYAFKFENIDETKYNELILSKSIAINSYKSKYNKSLEEKFLKKEIKNSDQQIYFYYDDVEKVMKRRN